MITVRATASERVSSNGLRGRAVLRKAAEATQHTGAAVRGAVRANERQREQRPRAACVAGER